MQAIQQSQYATGGYVFHSTQTSRVPSIRAEGLRCDISRKTDSNDILSVLEELGYKDPFPFDRTEVTYCYVDAMYALSLVADSDIAESGLNSDTALIVLDIEAIHEPMYLANMSIITDLIDYRYAGADVMMHARTPEDVVEQYQESIERVDSWDDIAGYAQAPHEELELVIDGNVPEDAVVDVFS